MKRSKGFCSLYSGKMKIPSSRDPVYACFSTARGRVLNYRTTVHCLHGTGKFQSHLRDISAYGMVNGCKRQDRTANMNLTYASIIGSALPDRRQSLRGCVTWGDSRVITWAISSVRTGFPSLFCACVCITFPAGMMLLRCTPETDQQVAAKETRTHLIMSCI